MCLLEVILECWLRMCLLEVRLECWLRMCLLEVTVDVRTSCVTCVVVMQYNSYCVLQTSVKTLDIIAYRHSLLVLISSSSDNIVTTLDSTAVV